MELPPFLAGTGVSCCKSIVLDVSDQTDQRHLAVPTVTAHGLLCLAAQISWLQGFELSATAKLVEFIGASQNHDECYRIGVHLRNIREEAVILASSRKKSLAFIGELESLDFSASAKRLRIDRKLQ